MAFNTFDIVDQIVLAQQFKVDERIGPLYLRLCKRHDPLTLEEARKLGLESAIFVTGLRERLCRRTSKRSNSEQLASLPSGQANEQFLEEEIWEQFGLQRPRLPDEEDEPFVLSWGQRSETFQEMFVLGQQNGLTAEGQSVDNPIRLDKISVLEFKSFLMALYTHECPECESRPFMRGAPQLVESDRIIAALRPLDMWDFDHYRDCLLELAISKSSTIDVVGQIALSQQYNIRDRIALLYSRLCQRHEPLTLDEARKLGLEGTALVAQLRERLCRIHASPTMPQVVFLGGRRVVNPPRSAQSTFGTMMPLPSGEFH
ncbi:hypothetical protein FRC07_002306 [Ceratobasidium sp. 392]|nr:hypothetical protein FRC07_002306 [Ceratobasidium sp. 392]